MIENKVIETERLILQPTSIEDAEFFFELQNSPKWLEHIGDRNIRTIEDARNFITTKIFPQAEKYGYSNYTIILKSDQSKIGSCGLLHDREGLEGCVEIGYAFLPEHHKKGYAFEAANKVKDTAFESFGIKELYAITSKGNIPSQRILEKMGFSLNKTIILPNDKEELLLYKTGNDN